MNSPIIIFLILLLLPSVASADLDLPPGKVLSKSEEEYISKVKPEELYALIDQADEIKVKNHERILFESADAKDRLELRQAIKIEPPRGPTIGLVSPLRICLYSRGKEIGHIIIVMQAGMIWTSLWSDPGIVTDTEALLKWFDARNISEPREKVNFEKALKD